jgi:hypothetical protein
MKSAAAWMAAAFGFFLAEVGTVKIPMPTVAHVVVMSWCYFLIMVCVCVSNVIVARTVRQHARMTENDLDTDEYAH